MTGVPAVQKFAGRILGLGLALALTAGSVPAVALDLTAGSAAAAECAGAIPHLKAAATAYLEPAPLFSISDYGAGRYAPSDGTNIGLGVGFSELSAGLGGYCIGVLYREEFEATATRDLLDILVGNHFGQTFDNARHYTLHYELEMMSATGVRLRRTLLLSEARSWRITLGLGASLLRGQRSRDESLNGEVDATSPSYAVGTASWTRIDSDLSLSSFNPFVGAGHVSGWGFSTDVDLEAQARNGTSVELVVMDAAGRMFWRDIRSAVWSLDNETLRYDSNFNRGAFVTGIDSRVNHTQRLPTKYRLAVSQPIAGRWSLLLSDDRLEGYHFPEFGARYGSDQRYTAATFDIRTRATGLSARWLWLSASVTTNRLRLGQASALGASLELSSRW